MFYHTVKPRLPSRQLRKRWNSNFGSRCRFAMSSRSRLTCKYTPWTRRYGPSRPISVECRLSFLSASRNKCRTCRTPHPVAYPHLPCRQTKKRCHSTTETCSWFAMSMLSRCSSKCRCTHHLSLRQASVGLKLI